MRPIDADSLKVRLSGCMILMPNGEKCTAKRVIDTQGTIEPEVRHGRWINNTFCSECKRFPVDVSVSISNQELTKYFSRCPHCGARMDGGANNGTVEKTSDQ